MKKIDINIKFLIAVLSPFIVLTTIAVILNLTGCAAIQTIAENPEILADDELNKDTADYLGYVLGAFSRQDPELREKVEDWYQKYADGGITAVDVLNEAFTYFLDTDDPVQMSIAYGGLRLIKRYGGKVSGNTVEDIGLIDEELLKVGQAAYLRGVKGLLM